MRRGCFEGFMAYAIHLLMEEKIKRVYLSNNYVIIN